MRIELDNVDSIYREGAHTCLKHKDGGSTVIPLSMEEVLGEDKNCLHATGFSSYDEFQLSVKIPFANIKSITKNDNYKTSEHSLIYTYSGNCTCAKEPVSELLPKLEAWRRSNKPYWVKYDIASGHFKIYDDRKADLATYVAIFGTRKLAKQVCDLLNEGKIDVS